MTKHHIIDSLKIEIVKVAPCTDVRFFAQQKLLALNTDEAMAELSRRAVIVAAR